MIGNAARSARAIGDLSPLLNEHAEPEIRGELKDGIGRAVYEIYQGILEPIFLRFPALREEFESNMERYGPGC